MSAHNGLLTHHEQAKYYGLVKNLVLVLQKRILRFYQARPCNEHKFVHILHRLIDQITHIEYINTTEPTFGDSLTELFQQLRTFRTTRLNNSHSRTQISLNFDDRRSEASINFELQPITTLKNINGKLDSFRLQERKKYNSFENVRMKAIIDEREEMSRHKGLKSKMSQLRTLPLRLQPPKLGQYVERLKKQSSSLEAPIRKRESRQVGEVYLGQKRRKEKRVVYTLGNK